MPKYGGRRYGYGRPGRRVRGYYRARSRQPGPIPGCLLPCMARWPRRHSSTADVPVGELHDPAMINTRR